MKTQVPTTYMYAGILFAACLLILNILASKIILPGAPFIIGNSKEPLSIMSGYGGKFTHINSIQPGGFAYLSRTLRVPFAYLTRSRATGKVREICAKSAREVCERGRLSTNGLEVVQK